MDEVSKAITVVSEREMEERDEYSIAEALRTVPGLRVQQLGGPGALISIKTRGLRNQDTAVLIDGLRFRDPTSPQGDASGFLSDLVVDERGPRRSPARLGLVALRHERHRRRRQHRHRRGRRPLARQLLAEGGGLGFFRGRAQLAGGTRRGRPRRLQRGRLAPQRRARR